MAITDNFESLADGSLLASDANWSVRVASGAGVPTMDQHDNHSDGTQVVDMSNVGDAYCVHQTAVGGDDHHAAVDVFLDTEPAHNNFGGPLVRGSSATPDTSWDGYGAFIRGEDSQAELYLEIVRIDNGVPTVLTTSANLAATYARSAVHTVRLEVSDSSLTAYVDDTEELSTDDSTYLTGQYSGFRLFREYSSTNSQPFVDNFASDIIDPSIPVMAAEHVLTTATLSQTANLISVSSIELDSSASTDDVGITARTWTETSGDGGSFDDDTAVAPIYTPAGNGPWIFQVEGEDADSKTDTDTVVVATPDTETTITPVNIGGSFIPSDWSM